MNVTTLVTFYQYTARADTLHQVHFRPTYDWPYIWSLYDPLFPLPSHTTLFPHRHEHAIKFLTNFHHLFLSREKRAHMYTAGRVWTFWSKDEDSSSKSSISSYSQQYFQARLFQPPNKFSAGPPPLLALHLTSNTQLYIT